MPALSIFFGDFNFIPTVVKRRSLPSDCCLDFDQFYGSVVIKAFDVKPGSIANLF
jgi:hypothetical protein